MHIFPPSSSSGSQPAPGNNNNNAVAEEMSVGSIIISELPMRTVSLSSNITSMSNNRKSAPPKKSGFVNQFLALKDKSEFINQNYGSSQSKTFSTSPTSPRSPKDPHHGIPAVDASNLQKLDALTFGVKVEEYPALNKAIRAVSPKRPPVVQKPTGSFVDMVMDDSGRAIGGNEGHQAGNETAVLQEGSVATVIYIPSPHRPSFGELVDSDSVFNSGAHSPAVLEPPVLDMDNEFNMSPWGVMNEPAEGGGDKEEYVGETEEKGEVDKEVIEVSDQESEVIEEIDEAIEESLDESIS
ncbi:hypothetical protein EON65_24485 [archaeon]|nr:MAG: hypothetical protein EON65_24485 [archaeon]